MIKTTNKSNYNKHRNEKNKKIKVKTKNKKNMMIWHFVCVHCLILFIPDLYAKLIVKVSARKQTIGEKFIGNFIFCSNKTVCFCCSLAYLWSKRSDEQMHQENSGKKKAANIPHKCQYKPTKLKLCNTEHRCNTVFIDDAERIIEN